jgi:hypothetical protein
MVDGLVKPTNPDFEIRSTRGKIGVSVECPAYLVLVSVA